MRNSKATHLVNHGVNIYNIRDFLGHVSVTTTQVYLVSNPEVTRAAIEKAALKTVPDDANYYSPEKKADLMAFLDKEL
jgi:site-specific recombinase XerD